MTKQEKLDKKYNKKLMRLLKAFKKGRMCRKLYEKKRSIISSQYYNQLQKLQTDG